MRKIYFKIVGFIFLFVLLWKQECYTQITTQTFNCTGATQTFVVPCINSITVQAWGAGGGGGGWDTYAGSPGGGGAYSTSVIAVTPGQVLTVIAGCAGTPGGACAGNGPGGAGGYGLGNGGNGGNSGSSGCSGPGGGGGGGSGVENGGGTILIVAGGGGGGGGGGNNGGGAAGGAGGVAGSNSTSAAGGILGASANTNGVAGNNAGGADGAGGGGGGGGLKGGGGGSTPTSDNGGAGGAGGTSMGTITNGAGQTAGNSAGCGGCAAGGNGAPPNGAAAPGGGGQVVITYNNVTSITSTYTASPGTCGIATATVTPTSGTGPYSYTWTPIGGNAAASTNLTNGNYTVDIKDANGCTGATNITITLPPALTLTATQKNILCNGLSTGSATATATGGTAPYTYAWSTTPPTINLTGIVTGLAAGTYTAGVQDAAGCQTSFVITITQPPLLQQTLTANTQTICSGNSSVLSDAVVGGTAPYTITWSSGGGNIGAISTTTVTPATTTQYSASVIDGNGCKDTVSTTVTVNPVPIAVASNNGPLCSGQTLNLTGAGGTTYAWTGPNAFASAIQNPSIANSTVAMSGVYSLTVTTNGCSNSTTTNVVINATPTVTVNSATICAGDNAALTAAGANTYSWMPATGLSATNVPNVTASPTVTTTYTVTGTSVGCSDSANSTVTVNPLPNVTVNSVILCNGATGTLTANGATTYSWNPATGLSASNVASVTANPLATTIYTVTGTDANNCTSTAASTVTVITNPTITVNNASICIGQQTATLTANGATTYSWAPPIGLSSNVGTSVNANPNVSTTYTIVGTVGTCTATTTATVTVNALPTVTANSATICVGSAATLTAAGAVTYMWSTMATGASINLSPNTTTSYTVVGTDANTCNNFATTSITVNPLPNVTVNSATICIGNSATLNANGAATYSWAPPTNLSATIGNSVTANPTSTTTYVVTGIDNNNCVNTANSIVTVNPLPIVTVNSGTICAGSSTVLHAQGASTYAWTPTAGLSSGTGANVTASPNAITSYVVTGTDLNNCSSTATCTVTVNPLPNVNASPQTTSGCAPQCVNFKNTGTTNGTCFWNFGDGKTDTSCTTNHCFNTAGTFSVVLTVTDTNGCVNTSSANVVAYPIPIANFNANPQPTTILQPDIQFTDVSSVSSATITTWNWNFGDNTSPSALQNPLHVYGDTGTFAVQLVITSNFGCKDSIIKYITIDDEYLIYVPNAFTPNFDGINDVFMPKGEGVTEYKIYIYDRWGNLVFYSNDFNVGWNGAHLNQGNVMVQQDVYVWKIEATDKKGQPKMLTGTVSLIK